jgi:hypothetical protein
MSRSRSITPMLASAAAHGTGPPPNVLPRSPTASNSVRAGVATTAPIGRPPASPLANVKASGVTPTASAAANAPQRPTPHCTSSNSNVAPVIARGARR